MSKKDKEDKPKKKKRKQSEGGGDVRTEIAAKYERLRNRARTFNRKHFQGKNEQLVDIERKLEAVRTGVLAMDKDWQPRGVGKSAVIPGAKIMLRPDLPDDIAEEYRMWTKPDITTLDGAEVVGESKVDKRQWIVKRTDGGKSVIPKRHVTVWFPVEERHKDDK